MAASAASIPRTSMENLIRCLTTFRQFWTQLPFRSSYEREKHQLEVTAECVHRKKWGMQIGAQKQGKLAREGEQTFD